MPAPGRREAHADTDLEAWMTGTVEDRGARDRLRGCSASTVEKQLENARAKLGCRSSPEAYLLLRIAELGRISDGPGLTTPPAPSFVAGS